jgi:signal transduction histidine kinase
MAMGLRVRVAVSFVLVTLGAVLVVEALLIGIFAPPVVDAQVDKRSQVNEVRVEAASLALKLGNGATIPATTAPCIPTARAGPVTLLLSPDRRIRQSSHPACYPVGAFAPTPPGRPDPRGDNTSGAGKTPDGPVVWAEQRVGGQTVYAQRPLHTGASVTRFGDVRPLLRPGLVVLVAALPVGLLFGYISMQRPVKRLRRLAETTRALADGELSRRIPVRGRDELAQLEDSVNRMAEQLSRALAAERELAGAHARTVERARIARELHDSVSQELFSLRVLASGLHRALPADSPLRPRLESMARSAGTATREMRALLLELRPVALAEAGLAVALDQLAEAYRTRLDSTVTTRIEDVSLTTGQEHALLRIAQEAVANAVRHGGPETLTIELAPNGLTIRDDGAGFDLSTTTNGMGLALMRERATEIGARLTVTSAPGAGTVVTVELP